MKHTRTNSRYTVESNNDMQRVREHVTYAFKLGIGMGYEPHEIFYEISSTAHEDFLDKMLGDQYSLDKELKAALNG